MKVIFLVVCSTVRMACNVFFFIISIFTFYLCIHSSWCTVTSCERLKRLLILRLFRIAGIQSFLFLKSWESLRLRLSLRCIYQIFCWRSAFLVCCSKGRG